MVSGGPIWQYFDDTPWISDPNQPNFGGDGQETAIHEIGHLLDLADIGDGGAEPDATPFPSATQDQAVYTAISDDPGWSGVPPTSDDYGTQGELGALDIAAIQMMYGTNTATDAGDTEYKLQTDNVVGTGWKAIWDPNGCNTISNEGSAKSCHIDLRAAPLTDPDAGGYPSYVLGVEGGFTIANGTEVDGATGGTGDDTFQTNDGPAVIFGGGGQNTGIFSQLHSAYILSRSGSTVTVTLGSISDTLAASTMSDRTMGQRPPMGITTMNEPAARHALIEACQAMNTLGINQGTSGNISLRLGDAMLISPSAVPYEQMRPEQVAKMPIHHEAGPHEGPLKPSTEWPMHQHILRGRPDINAVVHSHPTFATTLAIARRSIPACHYMVAAFGGTDVRCAGYATFGTKELASEALKALDGRNACLLANHGVVVCGPTLAKAMWLAVELETIARQYYHSLLIGGPHLLSDDQIEQTARKLAGYGLQDG